MVAALGNGIYTLTETAHLTGVSRQRVRAWVHGWPERSKPIFRGDYADLERKDLLSFLDLVDVVVVNRLRDAGVSFHSIRRSYGTISDILKSPHPFGRKELLTDANGTLFLQTATALGDVDLIELVSQQGAFPKLMQPFLKKVRFDPDSSLAKLLRLTDGVVLDPARKYGKPIVESNGMPTSILARAYLAHGKDADAVADWYGVRAKEVLLAVEFESGSSGMAA